MLGEFFSSPVCGRILLVNELQEAVTCVVFCPIRHHCHCCLQFPIRARSTWSCLRPPGSVLCHCRSSLFGVKRGSMLLKGGVPQQYSSPCHTQPPAPQACDRAEAGAGTRGRTHPHQDSLHLGPAAGLPCPRPLCSLMKTFSIGSWQPCLASLRCLPRARRACLMRV